MTQPGQLFDPFNPTAGITNQGWSPVGAAPSVAQQTAAPGPPGYAKITKGAHGDAQWSDGNGLLATLKLPVGISADTPFTWDAHLSVQKPGGPRVQGPFVPGNDPNESQLTQMTMAGAMSYLRDLAANDKGHYDAKVFQLVEAGYLTPAEARYGSFTAPVANAFLRSAADVWNVNRRGGTNQLMTWAEHIQALIDGRMASGQIGPDGLPISNSKGPQAPTRTDKFTNPDDVRQAINNAAENILGRKLTDKEVGSFQSLFHSQEQTANNQAWSATMSAFNNQSSTPNTSAPVTAAPSPTASAEHYMDTAGGAVGQERENQLLGSYVGILRGITGLGSGGVARAVN